MLLRLGVEVVRRVHWHGGNMDNGNVKPEQLPRLGVRVEGTGSLGLRLTSGHQGSLVPVSDRTRCCSLRGS